ncbi:GNAT family N-acetyltransferase [Streptomyces sp. NPDC006627]|uniref:GNAT family N-acetyltransferase n=1 Tax=Streptomyces sp. NPDC006627 TaxID=3154679 RepID=UPI0033BA336F
MTDSKQTDHPGPTAPRRPHTGLAVQDVRSGADRRAFLGLPYRLHRHSPLWVPPLRSDQQRLVNHRTNPFFDVGDAQLFLVRRGREVVGRVAAVDNPAYNAHHGTRHGFFGLFECADDPDAAQALLDAAAAWLRERDHDRMIGPVNFTTNDECGVLTDGFEQPPAVLMPYNPRHHPALLTASGLKPAMELLAWEMPLALHHHPRAVRLADHVARVVKNLRLRPIDFRDFAAETARLRTLYSAAWQDNWGFSPPSAAEFDALAKLLRRVARPELLLIAEVDGNPVGFTLVLPDIAPALRAARGRLHTCGLPIGLVRYLHTARHVTRVRVVAVGVRREYRVRGLDTLLNVELSRTAWQLGYRTAELSWTLAHNHAANRTLAAFGAQVSKRYALYEGLL